ncbi:hypothetical protein [Zobellella denitrificans]|uniref:hypothetical protein n=1 Tax=Zobellella denitrificans TaxID=347534 RepID=UPI00115E262E|nr:hypothetical protein [Zobellella denitrificans]
MIISLKWLVSLGLKFWRVVPWSTIVIVLLTLVSQLSALIASFLPLKVIILLGSDGIPKYIPYVLSEHGKDVLVAIFSGGAVVLFLLHVVFERSISIVTHFASGVLLRKSNKLYLFENQEEIASTSYQRFSRGLAGAVFFALGFVVLVVLYPEIVLVICSYLLSVCALFWFSYKYQSGIFFRLERNLVQCLKLVSSVGFFVLFGYLVVDFVLFESQSVMVAIVSILLGRIMLQRITGTIVDIFSLVSLKSKLEPLFFHGKAFMSRTHEPNHGVWSLVQNNDTKEWLDPLFSEYFDSWKGCSAVQWYQTGTRDVLGLKVHGKDTDSDVFLVKIFDGHRKSFAVHESTLAREKILGLPFPELIASTVVGGFHCLLYRMPNGRSPKPDEIHGIPEMVQGRLMCIEPSVNLTKLYGRSRPLLWERLEPSLLDKLNVCAVNSSQREHVGSLSSRFFLLKNILKHMPLVVTLPDITPSGILINDEVDELVILNWGKWGLDPIGTGWRVDPKRLKKLGVYLEFATHRRPSLENVSLAEVELVALASAFEMKYTRQLFSDALDLIPEMLARLDSVERRELNA